MVASKLGIKELVPPFLDPELSDDDVNIGVSFASAGTRVDDLTAAISKVIPAMKQIDMFKNYIQRLQRIVGVDEVKRIIGSALTEFYQIGCCTIVGCLPIQETISSPIPLNRRCLEYQNKDAEAYNQKLSKLLGSLQPQLPGSTLLYADIYTPLKDMINNPHKYGFEETKIGCCGTGLAEAGSLCNKVIPTCEDPSKYIFWDSIHPSEATYKFITESLLNQFSNRLN
ncbi:hypothetical protein IC582_026650 [Cucumis melo]